MLHHSRFQEAADNPELAPVADAPRQVGHQEIVVHAIKELLQIEVDQVILALGDVRPGPGHRVVRTAPRPKAEARIREGRVENRRRTCRMACCTRRSTTVGIPSCRIPPPGFGIAMPCCRSTLIESSQAAPCVRIRPFAGRIAWLLWPLLTFPPSSKPLPTPCAGSPGERRRPPRVRRCSFRGGRRIYPCACPDGHRASPSIAGLPHRTGLVSGSCSPPSRGPAPPSAAGFLLTPPRGDAVALGYRSPSSGPKEDLHLQGQRHACHTTFGSGVQLTTRMGAPFLSRPFRSPGRASCRRRHRASRR